MTQRKPVSIRLTHSDIQSLMVGLADNIKGLTNPLMKEIEQDLFSRLYQVYECDPGTTFLLNEEVVLPAAAVVLDGDFFIANVFVPDQKRAEVLAIIAEQFEDRVTVDSQSEIRGFNSYHLVLYSQDYVLIQTLAELHRDKKIASFKIH